MIKKIKNKSRVKIRQMTVNFDFDFNKNYLIDFIFIYGIYKYK